MKRLSKASFGTTPTYFEAAVANALKKEEPMKQKRFAMVLVMAILVLALACTAVAVGLNQSAKHTAVREAREAIMETYGFTTETLAAFMERSEAKDGGFEVVFYPFKNEEKIGEYTVFVKEGEEPTISWTHDGYDLSLLETAGMENPVWGPRQIAMRLAVDQAYLDGLDTMLADEKKIPWDDVEAMLQFSADRDRPIKEAVEQGLDSAIYNLMPGEEDMQPSEAFEMAISETEKKYGVKVDDLDSYETFITFLKYPQHDEPCYRIYMSKGYEDSSLREMIWFMVYSPSREIDFCVWDMPADERTLPDGSLKEYEQAVKEYIEAGSFALRTPAEKADIAERVHEAGYGELIDDRTYLTPGSDDLPDADIVAKANDAMKETFKFSDKGLELFVSSAALVEIDGQPVWLVEYTEHPRIHFMLNLFAFDMLGTYQVQLDAKDGTILRTDWSLADVRGTKAYTESDWGTAEAYDGEMLTWAAELSDTLEELYATYDFEDGLYSPYDLSFEDIAKHDQLMRDAGFDRQQYSNGLPGPDDLTQTQALAIAKTTVIEEFGVDSAVLEAEDRMDYNFSVADPEKSEWMFRFFPTGNSEYIVRLDAATGEILSSDYTNISDI